MDNSKEKKESGWTKFKNTMKKFGSWIWSKFKWVLIGLASAVVFIFGIKLVGNIAEKEKKNHDEIKDKGEDLDKKIKDATKKSKEVKEKTEEIKENLDKTIKKKEETLKDTNKKQKEAAENAGFKKVE